MANNGSSTKQNLAVLRDILSYAAAPATNKVLSSIENKQNNSFDAVRNTFQKYNLGGLDSLTGVIQTLTVTPMAVGRKVTESSFNFTDFMLEAFNVDSAVENPEGIDNPHMNAVITITSMVLHFSEDMSLSMSQVYTALKAYWQLQKYSKPRPMLEYKEKNSKAIKKELITGLKAHIYYAIAAYGSFALKALAIVPPKKEFKSNKACLEYMFSKSSEIVNHEVEIVLESEKSKLYVPGYVLLYNHTTKEIVLALRGTNRINDVLTDLVCHEAEFTSLEVPLNETNKSFCTGTAHKGMLNAAQILAADLHAQLAEGVASHSDYRLVITGHSLGAGVATLLTMVLAHTQQFYDANIHCYAFAPPCVVDQQLAESAFARTHVSSLVLDCDVVCRFGLSTSQDLRNVLVKLSAGSYAVKGKDVTPQTILAEAKKLKKGTTSKLFTSILTDLRATEMTSNKMFPAGNVIFVRKHKNKSIETHYVKPSNFDEITVHSAMFSNHMPNNYYSYTNKLKA